MHEGRFREDLYYRLNVVSIELPALTERGDDVVELLYAFLAESPRKLRFDQSAIEWLRSRRWVGNVRELRNVVERVTLLAEQDDIDLLSLRELVDDDGSRATREIDKMAKAILALPLRVGSKLEFVERAVLHHAIETCAGNKSAAARLVGVDRKALERRWGRLSDAAPDLDDDSISSDNSQVEKEKT
jgi:DNA-binding NtrC family response regulator